MAIFQRYTIFLGILAISAFLPICAQTYNYEAEMEKFINANEANSWVIVTPSSKPYPSYPQGLIRNNGPVVFHDGQAPTQPEGEWLALIEQDGQWRLEPTLLHINRTYDSLTDAAGETTGIVIESSEHPDAIAFLQHPQIKPGLLETPEKAMWAAQQDGEAQSPLFRFEFLNYAYQLNTSAIDAEFQRITYTFNDGLQASELSVGPVSSIRNIWIGDLDRDAIADILIWTDDGYNVSPACVFLSSNAKQNELVERAGCHITSGC
ncbi:hypothetical protein [Saezia sanguinis]|uniref:hypothetical protein n=1 Tax=Saezia sanguinis TaxID=1965230 RepID=UPI0030513E9A